MENSYLITKKPFWALFIFSMPMIIGNLFQQTYTMVDSVIVGRFVGEDALAAVGASYAFTNIFICIAIGGGIGASVIVSRHFGAGEYGKMKAAIFTALISFLALSILLGGFGFFCSEKMMRILKTPQSALEMSVVYLKIYFLGLPFLFMYNVLSSMFNALGKSKIPLCFLIFSSVLNIFLDWKLVTAFHMGVAGVAWATLIAQGISMCLSFVVLMVQLRKYQSEKEKVFEWSEQIDMTKVALPSILQQSTVSIGMMLVQSVVNGFGVEALAGFSAAMRIESMCIVPMAAIGNALSSYTAQNIGAREYERVEQGHRAAHRLVIVMGFIILVIVECFNKPIISMFLGTDYTETAWLTGCSYLRFMGIFFFVIGFKFSVDGILRGAGDMKVFTIANLVNLFIRVFIAMIFAPQYGIAMVWYGVPVGWFANWIISYMHYRKGNWRTI